MSHFKGSSIHLFWVVVLFALWFREFDRGIACFFRYHRDSVAKNRYIGKWLPWVTLSRVLYLSGVRVVLLLFLLALGEVYIHPFSCILLLVYCLRFVIDSFYLFVVFIDSLCYCSEAVSYLTFICLSFYNAHWSFCPPFSFNRSTPISVSLPSISPCEHPVCVVWECRWLYLFFHLALSSFVFFRSFFPSLWWCKLLKISNFIVVFSLWSLMQELPLVMGWSFVMDSLW